MSESFEGKVALVTGASRGLGRGIALALAEAGAEVAVHYAARQDLADEVVAIIANAGGRAFAVGGDLRDPAAPAEVARQTIDHFGRVDILVNNAGGTNAAPVTTLTLEDWQSVIAYNLTATFLLSQAVLPGMIERGWGRIISISSNIGQRGVANLAHYAAAKAGMMGFTRCLAIEAAPHGVIATCVAPGPIATDSFYESPPAMREERMAQVPLHRPASLEEIVPTVLLLAGEQGSYYVGQTLNPNGGHIML